MSYFNPWVCFADVYLDCHQIHMSPYCFKCNVLLLISTQSFTYVVLCLFSNERKIETLKNEYEARAPEVKENGVVSLTEFEEVKDKHTKELEEIKVRKINGLFSKYIGWVGRLT